jgi:hypothetical protein
MKTDCQSYSTLFSRKFRYKRGNSYNNRNNFRWIHSGSRRVSIALIAVPAEISRAETKYNTSRINKKNVHLYSGPQLWV